MKPHPLMRNMWDTHRHDFYAHLLLGRLRGLGFEFVEYRGLPGHCLF